MEEAQVRHARRQAQILRAHELIRKAFKGAGRATAAEQDQEARDSVEGQYQSQSPLGSWWGGGSAGSRPERPFEHLEASYRGRMGDVDPDALPPVGTRTEIYCSDESRLVRAITWVLAVKTAACGGGAAFLLLRQLGYTLEQTYAEMDALASAAGGAAASSLPGASLAPAALAAVLALFGRVQLQRGPFRVVTRMTRVIEGEDPALGHGGKRELIEIEHMSLLGTQTFAVPREMLACGEPTSSFTSFVVLPVGTFFLFPTEGWSSDDVEFLRTLLFWAYFRDDSPEPPADEQLIAIEGFGAYRPAEIADPGHPAAQRLRQELEAGATPGEAVPRLLAASSAEGEAGLARGSTFLKDGDLYARFAVSPRVSAQSLVDEVHRWENGADASVKPSLDAGGRQSVIGATAENSEDNLVQFNTGAGKEAARDRRKGQTGADSEDTA